MTKDEFKELSFCKVNEFGVVVSREDITPKKELVKLPATVIGSKVQFIPDGEKVTVLGRLAGVDQVVVFRANGLRKFVNYSRLNID